MDLKPLITALEALLAVTEQAVKLAPPPEDQRADVKAQLASFEARIQALHQHDALRVAQIAEGEK